MTRVHQELILQSHRQLQRKQVKHQHQQQEKDMVIHHKNINRLRKETERIFKKGGERWTDVLAGQE